MLPHCDQYLAIVGPGRMFKKYMKKTIYIIQILVELLRTQEL